MLGFFALLDVLEPETLKFLGTLVASIAGLIGVIVAALLGKVIAVAWLSARDKQDKEVEWRNHAIELTKLDLERKLRTRGKHDSRPLRPSIMDFLANYRDLQELGEKSPKELYLKIERDRITKPKSQDDSGKKGGGGKKKGS